MILNGVFGALAFLSLALLAWQWIAARLFPLHRRNPINQNLPAATLLKPLKGCDAATASCLHSWFAQEYAAPFQILFGVASDQDPVCDVVRRLIAKHPHIPAELVVIRELAGTNAKVSKLIELERRASHEVIVVSDADVRVPSDFLSQAIPRLQDQQIGLVNCFYQLANPATAAMQLERIAINADFWSQVLQSRTLKPLDFALGAVMITRRANLQEIGGFQALAMCLADDYQLGNRIAKAGHRIDLCPVVVECWDAPAGWSAVWKHQLRWARTIRVCQPVPYFFSILSNPLLWPFLWAVAAANRASILTLAASVLLRCAMSFDVQWLLTRSLRHTAFVWMTPIKDALQAAIWIGAFAGNHIEWRGQPFRLRPDGTLDPLHKKGDGRSHRL